MAVQTETLIYEIKVDDGGASKKFDAWDKKLADMKTTGVSAFSAIGSAAVKGLGLAFDAIGDIVGAFKDMGVDAVNDSIALEDALAGVRKTAGLTAQQTFDLQRAVRDFAVEELNGMVAAEDLATALEIAGQQGVFAGKSFEQGSQDALLFAKTMVMAGDVFGGLTTEKAAEGLGLLHGRFSEFIPDIERAASVINYFGDNTKRSEGFILNLAGRMAEVAATMGLTEQSTISIAATLGNMNQAGEKSGTAMNRIFGKMRFESSAFAEAFGLDAARFKELAATDMEAALVMVAERLQDLGNSKEGLDIIGNAMSDLRLTGDGVRTTLLGLGANADVLIQNLAAGKEQWDQNTSAMNSFIEGSDRTSKLWEALKNIFTNTIGVISDQLLPVFKAVLKQINENAAAFRKWFVDSEFITTTLPNSLADINRWLFDIIKAGFEAAKAMDWKQVLSEVKSLATGIFTFLTQTLPKTQQDFKGIFDWVKKTGDGFSDFLELARLLGKGLSVIGDVFTMIKEASQPFFQLITSSLLAMTDSTYSFGDTAKDVFGSVIDAIKNTIANIIELGAKIVDATKSVLGLGKEAYGESVFPDMTMWAGKTADAVNTIGTNLSSVTDIMAGTGESLMAIAGGGGFSNTDIQEMMRRPGFMDAGGLIAGSQQMRAQQPGLIPQVGMPSPSTAAANVATQQERSETIKATFVFGDQEIGNITAAISDRQQQNARRGLGSSMNR